MIVWIFIAWGYFFKGQRHSSALVVLGKHRRGSL